MPRRSSDPDRRPSPDALLDAVHREHRARFKVFVGAAPGVGKTYAMLQAAHERRREGVDVVVGVVETHGRAETQALLAGLEVVTRQVVAYRDTHLEEMALDAILARRPAIVLVDELAHSNAPGSRHPKRWQDVEELLAAGIDVYATLNIQHLESLNDVIAQITGVRVRETIPDRVLQRADELKLVDVTPEDLLQRLREGKVYVPSTAAQALQSYFRLGNLTALRELALRHTAQRVDQDMRTLMQAHAVPSVWPVRDRILVAVGGDTLSERVVRTGRRLADTRGVEWLGVFVESAAFQRQAEAHRERVARVLRLVEQLGGEAVTIPGEDVAEELVRYAERRNVSEIVVGKSRRRGWRMWWSGSRGAAIIQRSGAIDVRVVSGDEAPDRAAPAARGVQPARLAAYAAAVVLVTCGGLAFAGLQRLIPLTDPDMVFLTVVLVTAVTCGLGPSIVAAVLGVLVYDFFFVPPIYTLTVATPQDVLSLVVFLIVAVLTSHLTARIRAQAESARRREDRTAALYEFSRRTAGASGVDDLLPIIVRHVQEQFRADVVVLLSDGEQLRPRAAAPAEACLDANDVAAAAWARAHRQPAGRGTDTLPSNPWLFLPLQTARGVAGVLALRVPSSTTLPLDVRQRLDALAQQAAIAIERTRVDVVLREQTKLEAVMEAIEDGLIVLDAAGIVEHINEVACAIVELDRAAVLRRPFDQLSADNPHYLRLRAAVQSLRNQPGSEPDRMELALFLRGRAHYYMLRPTPRIDPTGAAAGLILSLQDVTYLRDQDRRREGLIAAVTDELRAPITSLSEAMTSPLVPADIGHGLRADIARLQAVADHLRELSRNQPSRSSKPAG